MLGYFNKEYQRRYRQSGNGKEYQKKYQKKYQQSGIRKEYQRKYYHERIKKKKEAMTCKKCLEILKLDTTKLFV